MHFFNYNRLYDLQQPDAMRLPAIEKIEVHKRCITGLAGKCETILPFSDLETSMVIASCGG